jgi:hypothetical protein
LKLHCASAKVAALFTRIEALAFYAWLQSGASPDRNGLLTFTAGKREASHLSSAKRPPHPSGPVKVFPLSCLPKGKEQESRD